MRHIPGSSGDGGTDKREAFIRRFKNNNQPLLLEKPVVEVLERVVSSRMGYYNARRRHSARHNQPSRKWLEGRLTDVTKQHRPSQVPICQPGGKSAAE
jgi:hypothetical protein